MKADSISMYGENVVTTIQRGDLSIQYSGWFLCVGKNIKNKSSFINVHLSDMTQIDFRSAYFKDVTADGAPELVMTYEAGYSEFHYHSGGSWHFDYLVILDTSDLTVLFSATTAYDYSYREVHYKDEEIAGVNALDEHIIVSDEFSVFELEYVVRLKENAIELVCMKYINSGSHFKEYELLNPGIIRYVFDSGKWIRE